MKTINTEKLIQLLKSFSEERDWAKFHSMKNLSTALMVEAGELGEIFQWSTESESNDAWKTPAMKQQIAEELADVLGYLLRIADHCQIDLESALEAKIRTNAEKYPVELAKGNSKKYTELKSES